MAGITSRTLRVIEGIASGDGRLVIATRCDMSESAVSREANVACRWLGIKGNKRTALVDAALRRGLIVLPKRTPIDLDEHLVDTLELMAAGHSNAEIAAELYVSVETVRSRVKQILRILRANDREHAVAIGHQCRLIGRPWMPWRKARA